VQDYQELASTQDAAIAAAHAGDPGHLAILAASQTRGRGSRGRAWASLPGNLNLSVLIRPVAARPPGHYALLAGVALHRALSPYADGLMLKWPNDLLLGGAKLGGILIDASFDEAGQPAWFVIGIGANLALAPSIPGRETAALPPPAPQARAVTQAVLAALDSPADVVAEWTRRAHPCGTSLRIETPRRRIEGTFDGITDAGALILREHAEPISSGEVFLGLIPRLRQRPGAYAEGIPADPSRVLDASPCFL
jgi:BirA family biotin operon repressor/biotin-[acetyl-CoA-carboxylase] ligase